MDISLSTFVPENLVSRDGIGSPVPRQPARLHTQAESDAYIYTSFIGSRNCVSTAFTAESPPAQGQ